MGIKGKLNKTFFLHSFLQGTSKSPKDPGFGYVPDPSLLVGAFIGSNESNEVWPDITTTLMH